MIKITEDVRVPGTDVILEAGDRIEVLKEYTSENGTNYDQLQAIATDFLYSFNNAYNDGDNYDMAAQMIHTMQIALEESLKRSSSVVEQHLRGFFDGAKRALYNK